MKSLFRSNNINYIRQNPIPITEYFDYATQSNDIPNITSANSNGDGIFSSSNSINYNYGADWNSQNGNVTTVGTNGSSSFYGTHDQCGQVWEWNDTIIGVARGVRGGSWLNTYDYVGAFYSGVSGSGPSFGNANVGFRISCLYNNEYVNTIIQNSSIEFITINYANNLPDNTGYGSVPYLYKIGKYPITNNQYCTFLNLKALSDPYGLYNTNMGSNIRGGIIRSGSSGSYSYSVKSNMGNKPVNYISWFDAARFANWLHNGLGSGSTEVGAYNLSGANAGIFTKTANANFWIPSEDEWYKAAFYKHLYKFSVS